MEKQKKTREQRYAEKIKDLNTLCPEYLIDCLLIKNKKQNKKIENQNQYKNLYLIQKIDEMKNQLKNQYLHEIIQYIKNNNNQNQSEEASPLIFKLFENNQNLFILMKCLREEVKLFDNKIVDEYWKNCFQHYVHYFFLFSCFISYMDNQNLLLDSIQKEQFQMISDEMQDSYKLLELFQKLIITKFYDRTLTFYIHHHFYMIQFQQLIIQWMEFLFSNYHRYERLLFQLIYIVHYEMNVKKDIVNQDLKFSKFTQLHTNHKIEHQKYYQRSFSTPNKKKKQNIKSNCFGENSYENLINILCSAENIINYKEEEEEEFTSSKSASKKIIDLESIDCDDQEQDRVSVFDILDSKHEDYLIEHIEKQNKKELMENTINIDDDNDEKDDDSNKKDNKNDNKKRGKNKNSLKRKFDKCHSVYSDSFESIDQSDFINSFNEYIKDIGMYKLFETCITIFSEYQNSTCSKNLILYICQYILSWSKQSLIVNSLKPFLNEDLYNIQRNGKKNIKQFYEQLKEIVEKQYKGMKTNISNHSVMKMNEINIKIKESESYSTQQCLDNISWYFKST